MKNNQILEFKYNNLLLVFSLEKDKSINLVYCGKEKSYKVASYNRRSFRHIVEVDVAEDNRNSHHGNKHVESSFGESAKYVSHQVNEKETGHEVVIVTCNEYLQVETHYLMYKNAEAISSFNVVKNINSNPVTLTYVSSFVNIGFGKTNTNKYELYHASNSWHVEAQWKKDNFLHLGIFNGNEWFTNRRWHISNSGSWSTKDFLPMMVITNKVNKESTLVQIENNGSWNLEVGDFRNILYFVASGPEFTDHSWKKVLNSGETFVSCQATMTYGKDFEEVMKEITKVRRIYRRFNKDNVDLPVIFNDYMHALWDTQTTELITPLVDVAASVGCDIFCMDAGWFAKGSDWWDIVGEWKEYAPNFPNGGLNKVIDYIYSKNMKPGLWIEPEAVGINSPIVKDLEDGMLFKSNGVNSVTSKRYTLNFDNPKVYKRMLDIVDYLVDHYKLAYIKTDYNTDAGVGNEWHADSLGDGLLKHNRAYIKWINDVLDRHPGLIIENCASGGCRMDNEILKYCSIQSTSDQTSYKKYPYLSVNVLTATTPEQAAVWSYPVNAYIKNYMPSDEDVVMNMCNAMLGRIHLASFINKLPSNQLDLIREGINYFNKITPVKIKSYPIFPKKIPYFFDKEVVGGLINDESLILGVWNTSNKSREIKIDLSKYNVKDIKVGYPTSLPTNYTFDKDTQTLIVKFDQKYQSRIFEFKR